MLTKESKKYGILYVIEPLIYIGIDLSHILIDLCSSDLEPPWEIEALVVDIRAISSFICIFFFFCFVPRSSNRAAHWVAAAVVRHRLPLDWVSIPPPSLLVLL